MITSRRLAVVSAASALVLATTWLGGGAASADTPTPAPSAAPTASPTAPSASAPAQALTQRDLSRLVRTDAPADLGTTTLGRQGWRDWRRLLRAWPRDAERRLPATFEIVYGHAWKPEPRQIADGRAVVKFRSR